MKTVKIKIQEPEWTWAMCVRKSPRGLCVESHPIKGQLTAAKQLEIEATPGFLEILYPCHPDQLSNEKMAEIKAKYPQSPRFQVEIYE